MTIGHTTSQSNISIQRFIFLGGIVLFVIKGCAFYMTNSVGILSDALESTVNIITGFITLQSLQFAVKPRDENHPYGHGKVELITASVEGVLIAVAGILIIIEAINRIGHPPPIFKMDVGIVLLLITAVANYLMGMVSIKMGQKNNSIALISGGKHLVADTLTTIALISGLAMLYLTEYQWVDSLMAIVFGCFIIFTGYKVLRSTINGLMDEADTQALNELTKVIREHKKIGWINIHKLTYLKFGHVSHVDLHLTLPWYQNVAKCYEEVNSLKQIIRNQLPEDDVDISIQSEPCTSSMCFQCEVICEHRVHAFLNHRMWNTEELTGKNVFSNQINQFSDNA